MLIITLSIKGQPRCGVLQNGWQRETPSVERAKLGCLERVCGGSEETLSYAGDLMFKIESFNILKHIFSQEAVAVASRFVTGRMHWSHVWKQILLFLFLMVVWAEEAAHSFSVFIQRGTDLKDL